MMKYKGYFAEVSYDNEAKLFHGNVIGLKDVITFQGTTVPEIEQAFRDSVDDYLNWCEERGEEPEKTYSGNIRLRMAPNLHANLALEALQKGVRLNDLINQKLNR